jgi:hypothetical protein
MAKKSSSWHCSHCSDHSDAFDHIPRLVGRKLAPAQHHSTLEAGGDEVDVRFVALEAGAGAAVHLLLGGSTHRGVRDVNDGRVMGPGGCMKGGG